MINYLKKFPTRVDYEEYISGSYPKPLTAYIEATGETIFQEDEIIVEETVATSLKLEDAPVGESAFNTNSLKKYITEVNIPNGITRIYNDGFSSCPNLTSVTIPNSVTSIASSAFFNCTGLTNVVIPSSVTNIDTYAFNKCSSLTSVTVLATTPPTLRDTYAFKENATGRKIYVPAESVNAYKTAQYWYEYAADIEAIPE